MSEKVEIESVAGLGVLSVSLDRDDLTAITVDYRRDGGGSSVFNRWELIAGLEKALNVTITDNPAPDPQVVTLVSMLREDEYTVVGDDSALTALAERLIATGKVSVDVG